MIEAIEKRAADGVSAARAYEALHVPALFGQWAIPMLDAAEVTAGQRVLDVACGTGVLARAAAIRTGPGGFVAGIDPDPGMLEVAGERAPQIQWRLGSAEFIPYPDAGFDAVVCQFGMMFFTDCHQALLEMLRVIVPRGRIAVAVWDSLQNSAAYPIVVELLRRHAGERAANALRAPFTLGDTGKLYRIFEEAGVDDIRIETRRGTARFPSIRTMVEADLRGWLPVMGVALDERQIRRILFEAEEALRSYVNPQNRVEFSSPAHIVTCRRP
jgi:ubiquinone/menaquinone biosynthesis C-methylase UbiE